MVQVIVVDQEVVRRGIKSFLQELQFCQLVGEAEDGLETVQLVEKLKPDVVILELMINSIDGVEVTRQVNRISPKTRIIVHTLNESRSNVLEAIRAGAKAYILKTCGLKEIKAAITEVMAGHHYLSPPLSELAIEAFLAQRNSLSKDPYETLTRREREIFQMVVQGYTNPEIAARLFISRRTVEAHRSNMMHKLGLHISQGQLKQYASNRGIVLTPEPVHSIPESVPVML